MLVRTSKGTWVDFSAALGQMDEGLKTAIIEGTKKQDEPQKTAQAFWDAYERSYFEIHSMLPEIKLSTTDKLRAAQRTGEIK